MSEQYFTVNIRAYLDKDKPTYIGEDSLYELLSDFSCPDNPDVEYFLLHNAIIFEKCEQRVSMKDKRYMPTAVLIYLYYLVYGVALIIFSECAVYLREQEINIKGSVL